MGTVIVIEFVTLDGIAADPDGSGGTPGGGWAFRLGPQTVAGDKFRLGSLMDTGVLLLGRRTWELFACIWPGRNDSFAARMNAMAKLVASRTGTDVTAWGNSSVLDGDLADAVRREERDVIVAGSLSVVHTLADADLVDEYRLLVFPTVLGSGDRLFPDGGRPTQLTYRSVQESGPAVLLTYGRGD